jgi:lipid-binding SYLF domain-containing protein
MAIGDEMRFFQGKASLRLHPLAALWYHFHGVISIGALTQRLEQTNRRLRRLRNPTTPATAPRVKKNPMSFTRRFLIGMLSVALTSLAIAAKPAEAASTAQIDRGATRALSQLYAAQPGASALGKRAAAILVFPTIVKAGLVIGGQTGVGTLRVGGKTVGYYNISAASYGLQAGMQTFSYVLFFMTESSLKYLTESGGWAIGSGPSVVVLDKGAAKSLTTTTLTQDVYAFPFGQRGLMAGIGLEGSKITRVQP